MKMIKISRGVILILLIGISFLVILGGWYTYCTSNLFIPFDIRNFTSHAPAFSEVSPGSARFGGISHANSRSEHPTIAVSSDGTLAAAWSQNDLDSEGDVTSIQVLRYIDNQWQTLPSPINQQSDYLVERPAIVFGPNNTLYVSWAFLGNIYVSQWNETEWVELGVDISPSPEAASEPSLAIGPDGHLFVAWANQFQTRSCIYLRMWDGTSWSDVGENTTTGCGISDSDIAVAPKVVADSHGRVYVAWADIRNERQYAFIQYWDGERWNDLGHNTASDIGLRSMHDPNGHDPSTGINMGNYWEWPSSFPAIAVAPNDDIYVTWPYDRGKRVAVRRWNPLTEVWENLDLSSNWPAIFLQPSHHNSIDIAIGPDNIPYLVWENYLGIQIVAWNGQRWQEVNNGSARANGISSSSTDSLTTNPSVAVGSDGIVYVAWQNSQERINGNSVFEIYIRQSTPN